MIVFTFVKFIFENSFCLELEDLLQINKTYIKANTCTLFINGREKHMRKNNTIKKGGGGENGNQFCFLSATPNI